MLWSSLKQIDKRNFFAYGYSNFGFIFRLKKYFSLCQKVYIVSMIQMFAIDVHLHLEISTLLKLALLASISSTLYERIFRTKL